ncbi:unnamed protein product [Cylicocyclus nassatus]|uniref:Uncharacterized protein n=1 Tax=Cylicocyclus nassatus TaxID=53992 RepID=A0AA36DJ92_CYLNA|nr:unnamed protein product [Cylicocyclus nassatus]
MATLTNKAFVIKKITSSATLLLVIDKNFMLGSFEPTDLAPAIGAVIAINYRVNSKDKSIIDVLSWAPYNGYIPMPFCLASKASEEDLKFRGGFYTCGCVRYKGVPLSNPAVFNDIIGVVKDDKGILERQYIGKLYATVKLCRTSNGFHWELYSVDEYMLPLDNLRHFPHGIVGAVKQKGDVNYITSRDFPHDVRFLSTNVDWNVENLLGSEVSFFAQEVMPFKYYVKGTLEPMGESVLTTRYKGFFALTLKVEHLGCRDDHGVTIVWSDKWEFMKDPFDLFKNCDYGIYKVKCIRHYDPNDFPRWKVTKVFDTVQSFGKDNKQISSEQSNASVTLQQTYVKEFSNISLNEKRKDSGVGSEKSCDISRKSSVSYTKPLCDDGNGNNGFINEDLQAEKELRQYMKECMRSKKVRAEIKKADPALFQELLHELDLRDKKYEVL